MSSTRSNRKTKAKRLRSSNSRSSKQRPITRHTLFCSVASSKNMHPRRRRLCFARHMHVRDELSKVWLTATSKYGLSDCPRDFFGEHQIAFGINLGHIRRTVSQEDLGGLESKLGTHLSCLRVAELIRCPSCNIRLFTRSDDCQPIGACRVSLASAPGYKAGRLRRLKQIWSEQLLGPRSDENLSSTASQFCFVTSRVI